ncbi:MAG: tetratricopeptide repeat protein [Methanothrix sp.]|nr:tetratricopeptide repeat protein [Methanothrix sp.]
MSFFDDPIVRAAFISFLGGIIVALIGQPYVGKMFENQQPSVTELIPSLNYPQPAFSIIEWTATASDSEHDTIYYDFFLKGPTTRGKFIDMTGWTSSNKWIWKTSDADAGENKVLVKVNDLEHFSLNLSHQKDEDYVIEIQPDVFNRNKKCKKLLSMDMTDSALECYNKSIQINSKDADAWVNRGNALYKLGRLDEAIESYTNAIEIDPESEDAYNQKGIALGSRGEYSLSIEDFKKATSINESNSHAWYNMGRSHLLKKEFDEAIVSFGKALWIDPNYTAAKEDRCKAIKGKIQKLNKEHRADEAKKVVNETEEYGCSDLNNLANEISI